MEHTDDAVLQTLINERHFRAQEYARKLQEFDSAIADRRRKLLEGAPREQGDIPVRPREFKGIKTKHALISYLTVRGGRPVKRKQIALDLAFGEAEMGAPERHERTLKITANNNRGLLFYDEDTDTISLVQPKKEAVPSV
jgi:hypothetical protein